MEILREPLAVPTIIAQSLDGRVLEGHLNNVSDEGASGSNPRAERPNILGLVRIDAPPHYKRNPREATAKKKATEKTGNKRERGHIEKDSNREDGDKREIDAIVQERAEDRQEMKTHSRKTTRHYI